MLLLTLQEEPSSHERGMGITLSNTQTGRQRLTHHVKLFQSIVVSIVLTVRVESLYVSTKEGSTKLFTLL